MELLKFEPYEDYPYDDFAITLREEVLGEDAEIDVETTHLNESGWTITGILREDHYYYVKDFKATHKDFGVVEGNFEDVIYAASKEAFDHFYKNHTPKSWNPWDA
jgi:hypothetical protein|tara:strand:+ start:142 stop:456 length:315 start_codon:yes stop_codon:yes gene_type:complete